LTSFVGGLNKIFSSAMLVEIWATLGTQCIMAFQATSVRGKSMMLLQGSYFYVFALA
jgi:hypothetical protein